MEEKIKILVSRFVFGDAEWRVLYGPPNEKNERRPIGVIDERYIEEVQTLLDSGDGRTDNTK